MTILDELRSGKLHIYAQWTAILAIICLAFFPFFYIISIGLLWIWAIISWVLAAIVIMIELPFLAWCMPDGSSIERLVLSAREPLFRAGAYLTYSGKHF